MNPKIISIGYSVPEHHYSQEEVFSLLKYPRAFWRLFRDSGIEKRHFWVHPLEWEMTFQEQQEEYFRGALELSRQAMVSCLDGRNSGDIGCLVYCSCTGIAPGPTIGHHLAKALSLSPSCYHANLTAQGCEGGYPGLKRAMDFTISTGRMSCVVACELSSCSYYPEPEGKPDPENDYELLRGSAIFADAASCILVGYDDDPRHPVILDTETYTDTRYLNELGYSWRNGRLRLMLSRRVPQLAPLVSGVAVRGLLERYGVWQNYGNYRLCSLQPESVHHWVIHAAGNLVLNNIRDALGITEEKLRLSRETLRRFGNCSSATVGITGKLLVEEGKVEKGDLGVVVSVGPGMTGGATLLGW